MLNPDFPIQRALILEWATESDRIAKFMKESVSKKF